LVLLSTRDIRSASQHPHLTIEWYTPDDNGYSIYNYKVEIVPVTIFTDNNTNISTNINTTYYEIDLGGTPENPYRPPGPPGMPVMENITTSNYPFLEIGKQYQVRVASLLPPLTEFQFDYSYPPRVIEA